MDKRDWATLLCGIVIGLLLAMAAVMVKDTIVFHSNCDGVVVKKDSSFSTKMYCIDPGALEGK